MGKVRIFEGDRVMKSFWTWAAMSFAVTLAGCDTGVGVDLTGLWIADSYEYRSESGMTVDLIERDGASMSLTVDRFLDGRRRVTTLFNDGSGETETMSGEVFIDDGLFTFETVVFQFSRQGEGLTLTNALDSFDFGSGVEPATLTIRLTQL